MAYIRKLTGQSINPSNPLNDITEDTLKNEILRQKERKREAKRKADRKYYLKCIDYRRRNDTISENTLDKEILEDVRRQYARELLKNGLSSLVIHDKEPEFIEPTDTKEDIKNKVKAIYNDTIPIKFNSPHITGNGLFKEDSDTDEPATIDKIINTAKKATQLYKLGKAGYEIFNAFNGGAIEQQQQQPIIQQQQQPITQQQQEPQQQIITYKQPIQTKAEQTQEKRNSKQLQRNLKSYEKLNEMNEPKKKEPKKSFWSREEPKQPIITYTQRELEQQAQDNAILNAFSKYTGGYTTLYAPNND